jgi:hypothetical protein
MRSESRFGDELERRSHLDYVRIHLRSFTVRPIPLLKIRRLLRRRVVVVTERNDSEKTVDDPLTVSTAISKTYQARGYVAQKGAPSEL